jgi:hypothetical protein
MNNWDPLAVYQYIRDMRNVNPESVYNNLIDLPLVQTGPRVASIIIGVASAPHIHTLCELIRTHVTLDELRYGSPFILSGSVLTDQASGAPVAFLLGHLDWTVRLFLPAAPGFVIQPELNEVLLQVGPFLGVGLGPRLDLFNDCLEMLTGVRLSIFAAPAFNQALRQMEMATRIAPGG